MWRRLEGGVEILRSYYGRLKNRPTLGVRAIIRDAKDVLLVKHTYVGGWHFPGGAVDLGETAADAAVRELQEEAGVVSLSEPILRGVFFNPRRSHSDHIVLYEIERWQVPNGLPKPNLEIAQVQFFPLTGLPDDTTKATRRRIDELSGAAISPRW